MDARTSAIIRLSCLAFGFLLAPGLLMGFMPVPTDSISGSVITSTEHTPVWFVPIERDPESIKQTAAKDTTTQFEYTPPSSREFTQHLTVVALHQASNAELQLITKTISAFKGRIDSVALVNVEADSNQPFQFEGVGYPHIQTSTGKRKSATRFRSLISYADPETRSHPIPNVRCMGLSPRAVAKRAKRFDKSVNKLATRYSIDANLVKAVLTKESCFNNAARSHVGAIGLMQLMPETAAWLKVEDPSNAAQNLRAGVRYLASLKRRFGTNELALAAYNAGPGNVERHAGIPPFKETQNYVKSVMSHYRSYSATEQFIGLVALN